MSKLTRRRLLELGAALGVTGALPHSEGTVAAQSSPDLEKYVQPLPIPEVREPDGTREGVDYYEMPIREFSRQLHPDLPETTLWGFDGQFPGPIIQARRNEPIKVRFDNSHLPDEHLLSVDERIVGTKPDHYPDYDGPVPEVRTVTHFHGLNIEPESDGQSEMWTSPNGVTGPRFTKHVHEIPNRQSRLTSSYHDHTLGLSRLNIYAGLAGFYFIKSQKEEGLDLPSGAYDIPLMLQDRSFDEDGSLHYPDCFEPNVAGDTAVVNGAVWPYLEVEPRRYRFRFVNTSNGRTYNLRLESESGASVPTMHQFAAGHGFLERVVPIGPDGDLDSLLLSTFERGDVIVDFSAHAGETFTVTNDAPFPFEGLEEHAGHEENDDHEEPDEHDDHNEHEEGDEHDEHGDSDEHDGDDGHESMETGPPLEELLQIRVADPGEAPTDASADPTDLTLPSVSGIDEQEARTTRHMTMDMVEDEHGLNMHLLNDRRFQEGTVIKPTLDTTEIWELENDTHHTHPIHLHLVTFDVIGRGPDGTREPDPNERVGKDTARVDPDETVRIAVEFGDFTGTFPWHCHILEHEDHEMMRPFEVVEGEPDDNRDEKKRQNNLCSRADE